MSGLNQCYHLNDVMPSPSHTYISEVSRVGGKGSALPVSVPRLMLTAARLLCAGEPPVSSCYRLTVNEYYDYKLCKWIFKDSVQI